MGAPRIRGDYDQLNQIARQFAQQAEACRRLLQSIRRAKELLQSGDWIGKGATAFYREMDSAVLPTLQRLAAALENASQVTLRVRQIIEQAEREAAAFFTLADSGGAASRAGGAAGAGAPAAAAVTPQQAQQIFRDMANEGDIAFNYPPDGCYARAHLMNGRILQRYGVTPSKVWAFGDLRVDTTSPYGQVRWGYHVAPAIPVTQPDGSTQMMVIDPSIAPEPVTVQRWAEIMHTSPANTQITATGSPPVNRATGRPFPGSGYWPGPDPTGYGGPDGYSAEVMRRYKECGNHGAPCGFVPSR